MPPTDDRTGAAEDPRLSRAEIVKAALELVDEVGLDGLTMRNLADRMGVSPMGLYRHVQNKDDLVRALADRTMRVTVLPEGTALPDPVERIVGFSQRLRDQILQHPSLVPLILKRPDIRSDHPGSVALIRFVLTGAGVAPDLVPTAFNALAAYILGFVALETSGEDPTRAREFGALLTPEDEADLDTRFETGIRALVAGLAQLSDPD